MLIDFKLGQGSIVLRVKIRDATTGAVLTGLTAATAGLQIAAIASNEAVTVAYTQAGGTIETIATLGTYAAPTAAKCRFKEVDATFHTGVFELQLADARFAVASSKSLLISITGASADCDALVPLRGADPYAATVPADLQTIKTEAVICAAPVTVLASVGTAAPVTGDAFARIGAAGAGLTALGDARLANLDASVESRSTYAGGAVSSVTGNLGGNVGGSVASVTAPVTVGTNNDKAGYLLGATGLDAIPITDPGGVSGHTTLSRLLVALYRRSFKKTVLTKTGTGVGNLKTYGNDGTTVNTTQAIADDGTTASQGAAS